MNSQGFPGDFLLKVKPKLWGAAETPISGRPIIDYSKQIPTLQREPSNNERKLVIEDLSTASDILSIIADFARGS